MFVQVQINVKNVSVSLLNHPWGSSFLQSGCTLNYINRLFNVLFNSTHFYKDC